MLSEEMEARGFYETENGLGFNGNIYAQYVLNEYNIICTDRDTFYLYNNGVYEFIPVMEMKSVLQEILHEPCFGTWTLAREESYIKSLERQCYYNGELNRYSNYINLKNCMFNTQTYKRKQHSPKFYSTIQLPISYDKEAECPQFKKFLSEIFLSDNELITVVQEIIGYCMTTDMQAQTFFIFWGTGANGKSLLCNIIKKLVGERNYSAIPISDLSKSFSRADLKGKLLNISAENEQTDNKPFNSQYIKSISGGDEIKAEFKGKDVFTFNPVCKLIFAVNTLPVFNDKTVGFLRRLKVIPFKARFSLEDGTADVFLEDKLTAELDGIFNWALEGLKRLRENNYKFSESKAMTEILKEYQEILNPYVLYWNDNVVYNETDTSVRVGKTEMFDDFKTWCIRNNHSNLAKVSTRKFWYDISMLMEQLKLSPLQFKKTQGKRFVLGIELKNSSQGRLQKVFSPKVSDLENDIGDCWEDEEAEEIALSPSTSKKEEKAQIQCATETGEHAPQSRRKSKWI